MDTDVIETAAPATVSEGHADELTTPAPEDLTAEDLTTEDLTAEDLTAEDLIEEVSIDGMCGVY
jgi:mycofactocin precursor